MCGKTVVYSIKNCLLAGLRRHLENVHTLAPIKEMFSYQRNRQRQRQRESAERGYKQMKKALFTYFSKVN
jgi:hypothetical protein